MVLDINVMHIFVGLNEDEITQRIAEAVIHEYCENFLRQSHRFSVIAELLVAPEWDVVHVPARIMRQLATASHTFLFGLMDSTDDTIFHLMCASVVGKGHGEDQHCEDFCAR